MINTFNYLFVTCFGIGTFKFAPGTITSFITTIFLFSLFHIIDLSNNITFVGKLVDPREFYENADIFILCSTFEGFGNVIVEALSFNCRVISSDCPSGPREILENGKWGKLFPVNNFKILLFL